MPRVSVIVPSYNHAPFLRERLDSILEQSYKDFELIVLDDCSTDNSAAILQEYQKRFGFRLVLNAKNSGSPFAQWNNGAALASGEYLWIAESDDSCEKDFLAVLVPLLEKNSRVGLAFCRSWLVGERGERLILTPGSNVNYDEKKFENDFGEEGKSFCATHLAFRSTIPNASGVLVRKTAFLEAGGGDPSMRLAGDWYTWIRILEKWDMSYSAKPLNLYRQAHGQTQRKIAVTKKAPIGELVKVIRYVEERFPVTERTRADAKFYLAHLWLEFAVRSLVSGKLSALKEAWSEARQFDQWIVPRAILVAIRQSARRMRRL